MQRCSKPNLAYLLRLHAAICKHNPLPQTSCNNVFCYAKFHIIVSDFIQRCSKPDLAYHIRLHAVICKPDHCLNLHAAMCFFIPQNPAYRIRLHAAIREPNSLPQTSCSDVVLYSIKSSLSHQTSGSNS